MEFRRCASSGLCVMLTLALVRALMLEEDLEEGVENKELSKAILEMLHINKLSVPHQAKPHPYMKQVYQLLDTQETRQKSDADGMLVQSFRSIQGTKYNTPGWIWFNVSHLRPSMAVAELVLLRKTLHPEPLTVTVAVHSLSPGDGNLSISGPLAEQLLTLDQLPSSGYDVFNVTAALTQQRRLPDALGFQLRFGDESGSLVLHEALTQSLYCLNGSSLSQPLLVAYRVKPVELHEGAHRASGQSSERGVRQHCRADTPYLKRRTQSRQQRRNTNNACRLSVHHVDVHKSDLAQWILQPAWFNISFCRGMCIKEKSELSVDELKQYERHWENITIQSLHCIPQELSPLRVMYRSPTSDIMIKEIKDIRAERCVCPPRLNNK
ncbi:bone morphogenetic protein 7-like [Astyanax mexicanus]|uniref:Bone morphogenetic protein 7-like n=2 Tax=Astyanax mexicanus TaxID=7994 RepID=A0A8T2LQT8_ASTMX|nr:bone morphogenetic protein 7-like [Astyanax mexicanus]